MFYNTGLNYPPRLAMEEVSVLLNNYKAQYGRNSGSDFNVLTRRGANAIHGAVRWEYLQNSAFNAADYLTHVNPHLVSNQFGATIGGPIKRDKMFFFLSYQDLRLAGKVVATDQTPSLAELGYDAPGVPHICSATSAFPGQQCGNYTADFCYVQSPSCPAPVTPSTAVKNPVYVNSSLAASTFNAAWLQSGHTGTSPCLTALTTYENTKGFTSSQQEHMPTPELPVFCFNPVTHGGHQQVLPIATTHFRQRTVGGSFLEQSATQRPGRTGARGLEPGSPQSGCAVLRDQRK